MGFNSGDTQNNYAARGLCSTGKLKWSVIMWEFFTGNCQHLDMNTQGKKIRLLNSWYKMETEALINQIKGESSHVLVRV